MAMAEVGSRSEMVKAQINRQSYIEMMLRSYGQYYDVHLTEGSPYSLGENLVKIPDPLPVMEELPIVARCDFHVQNDTSVLLRRNVLYSTQNHEYRYLFEVPHLSLEQYRAFEQFVYDDGMKRIRPGNGHMSTNLTLAIIAGSADPEAVKAVRHCSLHKEFRMGLDGWMDFHTNLVLLDEQKVFTNMGGHNDRKHLKEIFRKLNKRAGDR